MDDTRIAPMPAGGSVEPVDRQPARQPMPPAQPSTRYELRDPFAEVTHRSHSFADMSRKAERLGAIRFVAIDTDGKRTTIDKVAGVWNSPESIKATPRQATRPPARAANDPTVERQASKVEPKPSPDADRMGRIAALEATLNHRYLIKRAPIRIGSVTIGQTEYRHRGDTSRIAFTESDSRLSTDTNSPSVARSMVDVAEARNWHAIRVSGSEDFKRMVWLEASIRNVRAVGYEPVPADQDLLRKERAARHPYRPEPNSLSGSAQPAAKQSARGGGRKTVLAALEAVLEAQNVPTRQRDAVMAAAAMNLAQRQRDGESLRVKVYDPTASLQRRTIALSPAIGRAPERTGPTR